ncbi:MAG: hypothetical protein HY422_00110 [Candidatus Komeilibacteria bacterium]|nr:hypothetical protein [Candidatus Komeilibacteria bacterium]
MRRYVLRLNSSEQTINSLLSKYLEVVSILDINPNVGHAIVHMREETADRMRRDNPLLAVEEYVQYHPLQGHK